MDSANGKLRLRATEFVVDADDPFANDRLNRQPDVKSFCEVVRSAGERGAIILLDGEWGSGKTAFVTMAAAHLKIQGVRVAEFNAWRQGYTEMPLADLVAAISKQVDRSKIAAVKKAAGNALVHFSKVTSRGIVDPDAMRDSKLDMLEEWNSIEKAVGEFRNQLQLTASSDDDPLVVIIDELDRCSPDYAIDVLKTVRHLFDVPSVVVVLALNLEELCHTVQSIFGPKFTAHRYLRRFADQYVLLTKPDEQHLSEFLEHTLEMAGLHSRVSAVRSGSGTNTAAGRVLRLAIDATECNIRDLEQAIYRTVVPLASTRSDQMPYPSRIPPASVVAALTVLQVIAPDAYARIVKGEDEDGFGAISAINRVFGKPVEDSFSEWQWTPRGQLESILIAGMGADFRGLVKDISENISRKYQEATQCSDDLATMMGNHIVNLDLGVFSWVRRLVCYRDFRPFTGDNM